MSERTADELMKQRNEDDPEVEGHVFKQGPEEAGRFYGPEDAERQGRDEDEGSEGEGVYKS